MGSLDSADLTQSRGVSPPTDSMPANLLRKAGICFLKHEAKVIQAIQEWLTKEDLLPESTSRKAGAFPAGGKPSKSRPPPPVAKPRAPSFQASPAQVPKQQAPILAQGRDDVQASETPPVSKPKGQAPNLSSRARDDRTAPTPYPFTSGLGSQNEMHNLSDGRRLRSKSLSATSKQPPTEVKAPPCSVPSWVDEEVPVQVKSAPAVKPTQAPVLEEEQHSEKRSVDKEEEARPTPMPAADRDRDEPFQPSFALHLQSLKPRTGTADEPCEIATFLSSLVITARSCGNSNCSTCPFSCNLGAVPLFATPTRPRIARSEFLLHLPHQRNRLLPLVLSPRRYGMSSSTLSPKRNGTTTRSQEPLSGTNLPGRLPSGDLERGGPQLPNLTALTGSSELLLRARLRVFLPLLQVKYKSLMLALKQRSNRKKSNPGARR